MCVNNRFFINELRESARVLSRGYSFFLPSALRCLCRKQSIETSNTQSLEQWLLTQSQRASLHNGKNNTASGYVEDLTKNTRRLNRCQLMIRLTQDSMTRARIHRNTSQSAFYAVVAKYGADEQERANAVNELVKAVVCDGVSDDFKRLIIWTWASVSVKRGFIERIVDVCEQSRATIFRKKRAITDQLNELEKTVATDLSAILKDVCMQG